MKHPLLVVFVALLPHAVPGQTPELQGSPLSESRLFMQRVGEKFVALQVAMRSKNHIAVAARSKRLLEMAAEMAKVKPVANQAQQGERALHVERLRAAAELLSRANQKTDQRLLAEGVDVVRRSCVACHLQFGGKPRPAMYPTTRNTIYGWVRVNKVDGTPRKQHEDAVVFLDRVEGKWRPPVTVARVSQRKRQFSPRVLPVLVGTTVRFPNDDNIFHNVFSLSRANSFDLGLYGAGKSKRQLFAKTGLVKIYCNIHPQMAAHIPVLQNPFFAKTSGSGFFVLVDVPDGKHRLRVWNSLGASLEREVEVSDRSVRKLSLEVPETKKAVPHKNKHGRPYREKY